MWWVLLAACASPPPRAQVLHDAFTAAQEGGDAAFAGCAALADPDDRGFCELTATSATRQKGQPADCGRVTAGKWRDECVFEAADIASTVSDPADAVRQCKDAGQYRQDCVRHVSVQAYRREGGLGTRVDAAIHEVAPELDVQGSWRTETRHQVYVDAARHAESFTEAACATVEDPADCIAATAEIVQLRWERMARQHPAAYQRLCAAPDATGMRPLPPIDAQVRTLRLAWDPLPAFDAAVRRAQGTICKAPAGP
jgi:hypothetical protein